MVHLRKAIFKGPGESNFNPHPYVAIAYNQEEKTYLIVNFTTKRGTATSPWTIEVKNSEFPQILSNPVSVVEYKKAEEITAEKFEFYGIKKDSYGNPKLCPDNLLRRIIAKIYLGSELKDKYVKKYFPDAIK